MADNSKKGRKIGRMKDWCKQYAARGKEDSNRKKKRLRHLKSNPTDDSAMTLYVAQYGEPKGLQLTYKGRKVLKRASLAA